MSVLLQDAAVVRDQAPQTVPSPGPGAHNTPATPVSAPSGPRVQDRHGQWVGQIVRQHPADGLTCVLQGCTIGAVTAG